MSERGDGSQRRRRLAVVALTAALLLTLVGVTLATIRMRAQVADCGARSQASAASGRSVAMAHTSVPVWATATVSSDSHQIANENAHAGTRGWMIPDGHAASDEISGYAGAESASAGQALAFYVSTKVAGIPYTVDVYRLGWYSGLGGRLMEALHERGQAQGYYDAKRARLVDCPTCTVAATTHLVEANWQSSFELTIGSTWTTGLYVAKLTDAADRQAYVPFEVRGNPNSAYVVVVPDTTTAAYNDWGGYSLYHGPDKALASRATMVSFDRPAPGWRYGAGNGLPYEIDAIRWMERGGYDVSYVSSVDLNADPGLLLHHKAYLSIGHDEYWSQAERDGVRQARDAGVGLAFLGANAAYWRVRYAPDSKGVADRTIICYKNLLRDPDYGRTDACVTGLFRDAPISQPENSLIGIMYTGWISAPAGFGWHFSPNGDTSPLVQGTGLRTNTRYGCNLVGYEFDKVVANGATPPDLRVLATTQTHSDDGTKESSNTTYYVAPSGAFVFASGSIYWSYALDTLHIWDVASSKTATPCQRASQGHAIPEIQKLMANVMAALVVRHVGTEWA